MAGMPKPGLEPVSEPADDDGSTPATTRPPTQDPNRTRPSTFDPNRTASSADFGDAFLTQAPLDETAEACHQRHGLLIQEAQERAVHISLAQKSMEDLARAIEEAHGHRKVLEGQLKAEQDATVEWQTKTAALQQELEQAELKEEMLQAELIVFRGFEKGNRVFIAMMLERSRVAYTSTTFTGVMCGDEDAEEGAEGEGEAAEEGAAAVSPPQPVVHVHQDLNEVVASSTVDKLLFKWIFRLWLREAKKPRPVEKEVETIVKTETIVVNNDEHWKKLLAEQEQKLRAEHESKMEQLRKEYESKMEGLRNVKPQVVHIEAPKQEAFIDEAPALKDKIRALEKLIEAAKAEAVEIEKRHVVVEDGLRAEIVKGQQALEEVRLEVEKGRQEHQREKEGWKRIQAGHEAEKKKLMSDIGKVQSDLKQALVLSKYMREAMLKVKRDAAGKVAPEKLAELIEQLEIMREQLDHMRRDYQVARDARSEIMEQLESNRRRFELEKQFLPLIHKARGPLGPKLKVPKEDLEGGEAQDGQGVDAAALADSKGFEIARKMQRSMSEATRGGPKSLGLGGAGAAAGSP